MPDLHARHVILGAGAMGSAAAYQLARRGEPVVVVEQFPLGHNRGSSHGVGRITRHSYADPAYARLMPAAFRAWRDLEAASGRNLYLRTGGVSFCPSKVDYVARVAANLDEIGVPHGRLTATRLRKAFPAFQVPDDTDVVFEPDAGILAAARIVQTQLELAQEVGSDRTVILANHPVRRVDLDADRPTLIVDSGTITADHLIVTAGAWTQRLIPSWPIPLKATRQRVVYLHPPDPKLFEPGQFPVFVFKGQHGHDDFYGMPLFDGFGVKVAQHLGDETDPDVNDQDVRASKIALIRDFLGKYLPDLANAKVDHTETCLYNVAPHEQFQLATPPGRSDVIVASPCSGHGFKFAALIGRVLADLVLDGMTEIAIDAWKPGMC